MDLTRLSEHACFGGVQGFYSHTSVCCASRMRLAVFTPPRATGERTPALLYLAGLTCTEETFTVKGGAQRLAAELGLTLVMPDTSPREPTLPGDRDHWDFGLAASFYLDATRAPWSQHYQMSSYLTQELPALLAEHFPVDPARLGIMGHSMGGHGALVNAMRRPDLFKSVSAFAPVAAPSQCPWGQKALGGYLGEDRDRWREWDATELVLQRCFPGEILIDQGLADKFLAEQLKVEVFEQACARVGQALTLRRHQGYDHSYYFISTFVADHLRHHARALGR